MSKNSDIIITNPIKNTVNSQSDNLGAHPHTTSLPNRDTSFDTLSLPTKDMEINNAIAHYQDELNGWNQGPLKLNDIVKKIRRWAQSLWKYFIPEVCNGKRIIMPTILFKFEQIHPRVLGHYQPGRNSLGLRWEIGLNPKFFYQRTDIETASVVLHESFHCYEDIIGAAPRSTNNYHSVWFRKRAEKLGIPCTLYGRELGLRDSSPFFDWAQKHGLSGEPMLRKEDLKVKPKKSKRVVWICFCPPEIRISVLVARGSELNARCESCGVFFKKRD